MVLLVVDTQKLITNNKLYNFNEFENAVKTLIATARENNIEVIYVRHDDGAGAKLTKGTEGFEIYEGFSPMPDEKIFDKAVNSSFKGTGLLEYLKEKSVHTVVVVGLQTDYCIDATIKCGFEHGFEMIAPENANSTFDNAFLTGEQSYKYHNEFMWKGRYAKCISLEETIDMMKGKCRMEEKITLCGDNCIECPRYNAHSDEELQNVAELWYRVGWRDHIVSNEEIRCEGCSSHKTCTYHLVECTKEHNVDKCNQCAEFPCEKINSMLERSKEYQEKCKEVCSDAEYDMLEKAFFDKENNLRK